MAEIRTNRFQQMFRQTFGITEPLAPTLIPDVMPVFPIHDPAEAFLQFSRDVYVVFGGKVFTPAVGDLATVDIGQTAGTVNGDSALDVLSLALANKGAAAMDIVIAHVAGGGLSITPFTPLDGRRIGSEIQPGRCVWGFAQLAGFAALSSVNSWRLPFAAGAGLLIPWKATLYRSDLRIQAATINQAISVSIIAQERVLEPAETRTKISTAP